MLWYGVVYDKYTLADTRIFALKKKDRATRKRSVWPHEKSRVFRHRRCVNDTKKKKKKITPLFFYFSLLSEFAFIRTTIDFFFFCSINTATIFDLKSHTAMPSIPPMPNGHIIRTAVFGSSLRTYNASSPIFPKPFRVWRSF